MAVVHGWCKTASLPLPQESHRLMADKVPLGLKGYRHRRDIVFSQAVSPPPHPLSLTPPPLSVPPQVTTVVTSFMFRLVQSMGVTSFMQQLREPGFLVHWESLLSTHGDEIGMLEDFIVAIHDLNMLRFKVASLDTAQARPSLRLTPLLHVHVCSSLRLRLTPLSGLSPLQHVHLLIHDQAHPYLRLAPSPTCARSSFRIRLAPLQHEHVYLSVSPPPMLSSYVYIYRISSIKRLPRINAGCTHNKMRINAGSNGRAWQCPRGAIRARSQVPATNPSRVCLMSAKRKRSYDVAMKLQAVDVAETLRRRQLRRSSVSIQWSLYGAGASREK